VEEKNGWSPTIFFDRTKKNHSPRHKREGRRREGRRTLSVSLIGLGSRRKASRKGHHQRQGQVLFERKKIRPGQSSFLTVSVGGGGTRPLAVSGVIRLTGNRPKKQSQDPKPTPHTRRIFHRLRGEVACSAGQGGSQHPGRLGKGKRTTTKRGKKAHQALREIPGADRLPGGKDGAPFRRRGLGWKISVNLLLTLDVSLLETRLPDNEGKRPSKKKRRGLAGREKKNKTPETYTIEGDTIK